jgi:hypothetical protein
MIACDPKMVEKLPVVGKVFDVDGSTLKKRHIRPHTIRSA